MDPATRVQILDKAVSVSLPLISFPKSITPSLQLLTNYR